MIVRPIVLKVGLADTKAVIDTNDNAQLGHGSFVRTRRVRLNDKDQVVQALVERERRQFIGQYWC